MNLLSLSLAMIFSNPCNVKTSLKSSSTTCEDGYFDDMTKKWKKFVTQSTITYMQFLPCTRGKSVTNSMETFSHFYSGMGRGCIKPIG